MSIPETGQNPKSEARNPKQIQKAERKKIQNGSAGLNDLSFLLWICFGFRHSCFGFFSLPWARRRSWVRAGYVVARVFDLYESAAYLKDMDTAFRNDLNPGVRVKVTQQIAGRDYTWPTDITGVVVSFEQKQTGSWYAHSRGDKLWLDRLTLRKPDGELTTLILDDYTHIEVLEGE